MEKQNKIILRVRVEYEDVLLRKSAFFGLIKWYVKVNERKVKNDLVILDTFNVIEDIYYNGHRQQVLQDLE